MYGLKTLAAAGLVALASAQDALQVPAELTSFEPGTGTRSLWIPFQTISGLQASIAAVNTASNETAYVIACPTASPSCAIAPNVTLTEGPTMAEYAVTNTAGVATVNCNFNGTDVTSIECNQIQRDHEANISKQSTMLKPSQVVFQDVVVTATMTNSSTIDKAAKTSAEPTSTSTLIMSTSNSGAMPTDASWKIGGAVAGGLVALAAL